MNDDVVVARGLEGIVAGETTISRVDGTGGHLYYRGYSIEDLAANSSFSEVTYLLLYGDLPRRAELESFTERMRLSRPLAYPILFMIHNFPRTAHPMELLQSVISYLSGSIEHTIVHSEVCNCRDTLHQVVQIASVVATYDRLRKGKDYIPPRQDLSHGANFLYMLHGTEPDPLDAKAMDACLILHADHGFNASTFTARVVASTLSTCYSSISSAMGALYGPLHGGANERVIEMLEEIGSVDNVEPWVHKALREKRRIMGMGHRVYKVKDPRAKVLEGLLRELAESKGDLRQYEILTELERITVDRMSAQGKEIYPNVDFYSGAVYQLLGIDTRLFTPIFAMSRVAGWLAHVLEQRHDNRLFRPKSHYVGHEPRQYVPIDSR